MTKSGVISAGVPDEGPMWNNFWNSTFTQVEADQQSVSSNNERDRSSHVSYRKGMESSFLRSPRELRTVSPDMSMTSMRESQSRQSRPFIPFAVPEKFSFKLKVVEGGRVYRFSSQSDSISDFHEFVRLKTGYSVNSNEKFEYQISDGMRQLRLAYLDEDGDAVCLESDKDLHEAVRMSVNLNLTR